MSTGRVIGLAFKGYRHETMKHSAGAYVREQAYANGIESVWRVIKRGFVDVYRHWSMKQMQACVDGFTFRLNGGSVNADAQDRLNALTVRCPIRSSPTQVSQPTGHEHQAQQGLGQRSRMLLSMKESGRQCFSRPIKRNVICCFKAEAIKDGFRIFEVNDNLKLRHIVNGYCLQPYRHGRDQTVAYLREAGRMGSTASPLFPNCCKYHGCPNGFNQV